MSLCLIGFDFDEDPSRWPVTHRVYPTGNAEEAPVEIFGRYERDSGSYLFAIRSRGGEIEAIGAHTTLWLNTDQDRETGYLIWGWAGGAEYNINFDEVGVPRLFTGDAGEKEVAGPLEFARFDQGRTILIALPVSLLHEGDDPGDIDFLIDINNRHFFPASFSSRPFTLSTRHLPPRTDFSKRVGIVFSDATTDNYYNNKAYAQLFMSVQHQAMMAGIPFVLLNQSDLTDLQSIINLDALVFPSSFSVDRSGLEEIERNLTAAVFQYGIGIITSGDWLTNDENNEPLPGDSYERMAQMLGVRRSPESGFASVSLRVSDPLHPVTSEYRADEIVLQYPKSFFTHYQTVGEVGKYRVLAEQDVFMGPESHTYNALIAVENTGRHLHFASPKIMVDANLLWKGIQWVVYGDQNAVGLKLTRQGNLFVARNDMDKSMYFCEMLDAEVPLLERFLIPWKDRFNFVGSYYINVGYDDPSQCSCPSPQCKFTDWEVARALYGRYMDLGNEIGTHSYTHPFNMNFLSPHDLEFEFKGSRDVITRELGLEYCNAAQPGNPENLLVAREMEKWFTYFSGGYSGVDQGYPSAIGFLAPDSPMVFFSPNLLFDFTMIEYLNWDTVFSENYWKYQYDQLMNHASQPILHWPWHDYGPTVSAGVGGRYSVEMFESMVEHAFNHDSEFATAQDAHLRILNFRDAILEANKTPNGYEVNVEGQRLGQFCLKLNEGESIREVRNWFAFADDRVFLPDSGGHFQIRTDGPPDPSITRITRMPMRSRLLSLSGDGRMLDFRFEGEGVIEIQIQDSNLENAGIFGADDYYVSDGKLHLVYLEPGLHQGQILLQPEICDLTKLNQCPGQGFQFTLCNTLSEADFVMQWSDNLTRGSWTDIPRDLVAIEGNRVQLKCGFDSYLQPGSSRMYFRIKLLKSQGDDHHGRDEPRH